MVFRVVGQMGQVLRRDAARGLLRPFRTCVLGGKVTQSGADIHDSSCVLAI